MKLNSVAMGNALGGATAILFAICAAILYSARDLGVSFIKSLVHSIDTSGLTANPQPFEFGTFALGWVGITIFMWVFGWLLGTVYNASAGGRESS